jgi:dolichyl-phosphate-mannose-protein mannosyltransferase
LIRVKHWLELVRSRPLATLLGLFLILAVFYSLIIPIFEGPDEDDHFRYVRFIADHRALPLQLFEPGGGEAGHQGWQPPLYYSLAATLIAAVDTGDFSQHLWRNEYVTFVGDPACCGRNIYYHTESENFPYIRTTLAVHLARLLSIFFGAVAVGATFAMAKRLAPNDRSPALAMAAGAVVAFNPSFLFASSLVSNDSALVAWSSLTLLGWVKLICGEMRLDLKSGAALGLVVGLALLTKTTALGLVPLSILLFAVLAWRSRSPRAFLLPSITFLFVIAVVSGWWFARNLDLYGDPLAARLVSASALFPRAGELTLAELAQISLPQVWTTFWGGPTPSDFSPILLVLLALATIIVGVGIMLRVTRITNYQLRFTFCFFLAWLALLFFAMLQFIRTTQGGDQGRYLFPAISAFALLFVLGLDEIANRIRSNGQSPITSYVSRFADLSISNLQSLVALSLTLCFFALALFVPIAYTLPAYARPALLSAQDVARLSDAASTNFDNQIELLGYELGARSYKPGESLHLSLYWRALAPMTESYRIFVHLVGQRDISAGGIDVIPARGAFPTVYWKPGDALRDNYQIPITPNAVPGKYSLEVGLYPVGKPGERLTAVGSGDDRVLLAPVKVAPTVSVNKAPSTAVGATFADQIELIGYDSAVEQNRVRLILYWRAKKKIEADYTVFVHALDASGKLIGQVDHQPQEGYYPTSIWDVGEEVLDPYVIELDAVAQRLVVGLYRAETGERLPMSSSAGTSDHLEFILRPPP